MQKPNVALFIKKIPTALKLLFVTSLVIFSGIQVSNAQRDVTKMMKAWLAVYKNFKF